MKLCLCVFQGDIEGVNAKPNDRKVRTGSLVSCFVTIPASDLLHAAHATRVSDQGQIRKKPIEG